MAQLYKGTVVPQVWFQYTQTGKAMLKFKVRLKDDPNKRISVVVFGNQAEKNSEMEAGEEVIVTGTWKENDYQGKVENNLLIGDYGGNLKRTGAKSDRIHSQTAPQRRKAAEGNERIFLTGDDPEIDDPPEDLCDPDAYESASDREWERHADYLETRVLLALGEISDPNDAQYELCFR